MSCYLEENDVFYTLKAFIQKEYIPKMSMWFTSHEKLKKYTNVGQGQDQGQTVKRCVVGRTQVSACTIQYMEALCPIVKSNSQCLVFSVGQRSLVKNNMFCMYRKDF